MASFRPGEPASGARSGVRVRYAAMEAEGVLDVTVVRRVIRRHQPELEECYDEVAAAPRDPVVLRLEIDPRGVVSAARAESDEVPAEANECARAAALTWAFPEAEGATRVSAPFRLGVPGEP
ncbi:MAG: AgmX/PglI C-terminal domain-containing protein [Myxococcota bacterium]|nr:AgmX/PglI C-terminal domain-containing protein [Myxococcota bacterium]